MDMDLEDRPLRVADSKGAPALRGNESESRRVLWRRGPLCAVKCLKGWRSDKRNCTLVSASNSILLYSTERSVLRVLVATMSVSYHKAIVREAKAL